MINFTLYKERIIEIFRKILEHPALLVILFHAFLVITLNGIGMGSKGYEEYVRGFGQCNFAPLLAVAVVCLDRLTKGMRFRPSWLIVIVYLILAYIPSLDTFYENTAFFVLNLAVAPLCYLTIKRRSEDHAFVKSVVKTAFNGAFAVIFTGVLALLLLAFNASIDFLFNLRGEILNHTFLTLEFFCFFIICPSLFVALDSEEKEYPAFEKVIQAILNYAVSPALVLYTAVLYAYIIKIIIQWNLPKGGVAYMVLTYGIILILSKAYQYIQDKKPFEWFYNRSWAISIPILCLFWIGVIRRLSDYGVTIARYYLVIVGVFLCLFLLLRNTRKSYHSLFVTLGICLISSVALPWVNNKSLSISSQVHIVSKHAEAAGILTGEGTLSSGSYTCDNTEQAEHFRRVFQSLSAIKEMNPKALEKFGISNCQEFIDHLPESMKNNVYSSLPITDEIFSDELNGYICLFYDCFPLDIQDYRTILDIELQFDYDLSAFGVNKDTVIQEQFEKCGASPDTAITRRWLEEHKNDLLVIRNEKYMIVLRECDLTLKDGKVTNTPYFYSWMVLEK